VVIAIIAILVSILMPSLRKARLVAMRGSCLVNARGTMTSLHMYANDYGEFPVNINPNNWADDWITPNHPRWTTDGYNNGNYGYTNGNSPPAWPTARHFAGGEGAPSHWRGYLIDGKYGNAGTFGCSQGIPSNGIIHSGTSNWKETSAQDQMNVRKNPPYVYLGPGVDPYRSSEYYLGIYVGSRHWRSYRMGGTPILAESCYYLGYDETLFRYNFHGGVPYYRNSGGPPGYYRSIDMTVAWTDGRAANHVYLNAKPGYGGAMPKLFEHNWTQWDHLIR